MTTAIQRLCTEPDPRLVLKFARNFAWKSVRTVARWKRRTRRGGLFPAFLFISVTSRCNLRCDGCWVTAGDPADELTSVQLDRVIGEAKSMGSFFFGLLGGEPLLHEGLLDVLERHPDCYFQLFTNGTLLTPETAAAMRRLGNVTPLVSIEGLETESDRRRGGTDVYARAVRALEACRAQRLITGVATSVCAANFADVVSERFVADLVSRGVHYVWYYIYRPVGGAPAPTLALGEEQILALRRFIVDIRGRVPIVVVDAYWDHRGRAMCPAAEGVSHHIGPGGWIEPCPPVQFATERIDDGPLAELFERSAMIRKFREARGGDGGCVLLDTPSALQGMADAAGARDTSGRGRGREEIASMACRPSHHLPGREIPERNFWYRQAKKNWFFGMGAYG